jgi:hypothetical protein
VLESLLLLAALVGIGLFAYSLVDILRIETAAVRTTALPPSAWPGVFLFFGSMVLLQVVRGVLQRYRRDDGTFRGDARGRAADTTADILSSVEDDSEMTAPAEAQGEG